MPVSFTTSVFYTVTKGTSTGWGGRRSSVPVRSANLKKFKKKCRSIQENPILKRRENLIVSRFYNSNHQKDGDRFWARSARKLGWTRIGKFFCPPYPMRFASICSWLQNTSSDEQELLEDDLTSPSRSVTENWSQVTIKITNLMIFTTFEAKILSITTLQKWSQVTAVRSWPRWSSWLFTPDHAHPCAPVMDHIFRYVKSENLSLFWFNIHRPNEKVRLERNVPGRDFSSSDHSLHCLIFWEGDRADFQDPKKLSRPFFWMSPSRPAFLSRRPWIYVSFRLIFLHAGVDLKGNTDPLRMLYLIRILSPVTFNPARLFSNYKRQRMKAGSSFSRTASVFKIKFQLEKLEDRFFLIFASWLGFSFSWWILKSQYFIFIHSSILPILSGIFSMKNLKFLPL